MDGDPLGRIGQETKNRLEVTTGDTGRGRPRFGYACLELGGRFVDSPFLEKVHDEPVR